ncbi:MAG: arsenic resistance protein [Pseudomonadota bacterium]
MLNPSSTVALESSFLSAATLVLIGSILVGSILGHLAPDAGLQLGMLVDYTLLVLVSLLFFGIRFESLKLAAGNWGFIAIALLANFVIVPILGYGIASLFIFDHPLLFVGLVIYFMAPCTDWFLGFTRLSGGNVALGSTLLPINMILQLVLYPLYLQLFTHQIVETNVALIGISMLQWFMIPLAIAFLFHQISRMLLKPSAFENLLQRADKTIPWLIGLLVLEIFAANVHIILLHYAVFAWMLIAVFIFFLFTFLLSEGLTYLFRLPYAERALLTMTLAARNAPLMLVVSMTSLPGQPLIYAALIIGMLLELPHLTVLQRLLLITQKRYQHRNVPGNLPKLY